MQTPNHRPDDIRPRDISADRRSFLLRATAAVATGGAFVKAAAQVPASDLPPPGKQMKIIVPFSPGGTSDILGRKLAQILGERLGRTVIVDNRAGAGGSLGTEAVSRSDADGSTILLHSGAIAVDPVLKRNLPYDVLRDLAPVTTAVSGPFALLVSNDLPVRSVAELLAYARANPGKLAFGTPGIGSSIHLTTEHFKSAAGIDILHVPYKGANLALTAAMSNEIQILIDPLATAKKYAESGRLRALAVTTGRRTDLWPEMPTISEGGVKGFDASVWYAAFVPSKTPRAVVDRLNAELVAILKSPDMKGWLREQGLEAIADSPDAARKRMADEIVRWQQVAQSAGVKPE